jgi:hypothetical protein
MENRLKFALYIIVAFVADHYGTNPIFLFTFWILWELMDFKDKK